MEKYRTHTQEQCKDFKKKSVRQDSKKLRNEEVPAQSPVCVCVCVFVLSSHYFCVSDLWTHQPRYTGGGHTRFLHLPSAVLALIFIAGRIQPSLSLFDREVEFLGTHELIVLHLWGMIYVFIFERKNPSSYDCTEIRSHVPMPEGFEVTN